MPERCGFVRPAGAAGARDKILVLPSVVCSGLVAEELETEFAVALTHQHGCLQVGDDLSHSRAVFAGLGANPNVAATVVVSLGCETLQGRRLAEAIAAAGQPAELVEIQAAGGTAAAVAAGRALVEELHGRHGGRPRQPVPQSEVLLGLDAAAGPVATAIAAEAERRGVRVLSAGGAGTAGAGSHGPVVHPELAAAGAQVIVAVVDPEQAPVGFPLCPVVAVAQGGELHAALGDDFDVDLDPADPEPLAVAAVDKALAAFDGEPCKAERRGASEFVLRRLAITM